LVKVAVSQKPPHRFLYQSYVVSLNDTYIIGRGHSSSHPKTSSRQETENFQRNRNNNETFKFGSIVVVVANTGHRRKIY